MVRWWREWVCGCGCVAGAGWLQAGAALQVWGENVNFKQALQDQWIEAMKRCYLQGKHMFTEE